MLFTTNLVERLESLVSGTGEGADVPPLVRATLQASIPIRVLKSFEPLYTQHVEANGTPERGAMLETLKQVCGLPFAALKTSSVSIQRVFSRQQGHQPSAFACQQLCPVCQLTP